MTLRINNSYQTSTGFLIPRSHFKADNGLKYAIVEILETDGRHYIIKHTCYDSKQFRKALSLSVKEGVTIE